MFHVFYSLQVCAYWLPHIGPSLFLWWPFPGLPGAPGGEEYGTWEEGNAGGVDCSSGLTTAGEQAEWVWEAKEPRGENKAMIIPAWAYTIISSTFPKFPNQNCPSSHCFFFLFVSFNSTLLYLKMLRNSFTTYWSWSCLSKIHLHNF